MDQPNAIVTVSNDRFIAPVADVVTALRRYQAVKDFISQVLREGVDFGLVPGATKPSLFKPGAEKMTSFFGFSVRFLLEDRTEDWTGETHSGEPFFYYRYRCQLWRGDNLIAEGEGSASSWESKYRYRQAERVCPACGKATIIKGKAEYGGGWICFARKGGCGAKYGDNDERITGQQLGRVKNPDPADVVNTLQKMAQKRALVAPVLIATNTSDYFTQDIEDFMPAGEVVEGVATEQPKAEQEQAVKAPAKMNGGKSYPGAWVQEIIKAQLAENAQGATGMLGKSNLAGDATVEQVIAWARLYRGWRDSNSTPEQAAEKANEGKAP